MSDLEERYDLQTAAAWILGHARRTGIPDLPRIVLQKTADDFSDEELLQIVAAGQAAELKLYPFQIWHTDACADQKNAWIPALHFF